MSTQPSDVPTTDTTEAPAPSFRSTLIRVLTVQVLAVAALWALQRAFDK